MEDFEAFILAGGNSSRMGRDKAVLELDGGTFIERIGSELEKCASDRVKVIGGSCETHGFQLLGDVFHSDRRAAIIGLHAALFHGRTQWILAVACDLPFIRAELFEILDSRISVDADAVVPLDAEGRPQPLCALYQRESCLAIAENTLKSDNWSLGNFLEQLNVLYLPFAEFAGIDNAERLFINVNTPEDLRIAEALSGSAVRK